MLYRGFTTVYDYYKLQERNDKIESSLKEKDTQHDSWIKLLVSSLTKLFKKRS